MRNKQQVSSAATQSSSKVHAAAQPPQEAQNNSLPAWQELQRLGEACAADMLADATYNINTLKSAPDVNLHAITRPGCFNRMCVHAEQEAHRTTPNRATHQMQLRYPPVNNTPTNIARTGMVATVDIT
jgi:hypothetical protein